jgi:HMG box factor, other
MGYQQHRLSQGHIPHDRSLTLPPLQMGHAEAPISPATPSRTSEEQIMNINFRYKIKVLSQVAPPATKSKDRARGPLIAIEADSPEAAKEFADWLRDTLNVSDDLTACVIDGPKISASGGKEQVMAQYHRLASEWLFKSKDILQTITIPTSEKASANSAMPDATSSPAGSSRKVDESYNDTESESRASEQPTEPDKSDEKSEQSRSSLPDSMDVDKDSKRNSAVSAGEKPQAMTVKPISIIANYSLSTSNLVACLIPLGSNDPYSPNDHWQWTATQWRGIIGPDLTIYIRDATSMESGRPPVEIEFVEGRPDVGLFVMRQMKTEAQEGTSDGSSQVEASVLRRMGFEVGEWVRAFGTTSIN